MTLHVAFVCPTFVVVVGDRLLSLEDDHGNVSAWDQWSNKTVIIRAKDGIVVVSYAGLGHIAGIPVDIWLISRLSGRAVPTPMAFGLNTAFETYPPPDDWESMTVGHIRDLIAEYVES